MFSPQGSPTLKQHTQTIWYWLVHWNHGILFFFPGVGQPPTRISRVCSQRSQEPQPHGWGVAGWHAAATQNLQCSCTRSWNCQLRCFNLSWNLSDEQWQKVALEKDMRGERYIHEIYLSRAVAQGDRTCERWKNIAEQFTFSCHNSQDSEVVFLLVHHGSESHILTID